MTGWPKHHDGSPKRFGDMKREEQEAVIRASVARLKAEMEAPAMTRALSNALKIEEDGR